MLALLLFICQGYYENDIDNLAHPVHECREAATARLAAADSVFIYQVLGRKIKSMEDPEGRDRAATLLKQHKGRLLHRVRVALDNRYGGVYPCIDAINYNVEMQDYEANSELKYKIVRPYLREAQRHG